MKDIKYYDKDIERKRVSIVEALTVIIVFLISFWVGYVTGVQMKKCQTCRYFPCTKIQCNIENKEGCNDYRSIVQEEIKGGCCNE